MGISYKNCRVLTLQTEILSNESLDLAQWDAFISHSPQRSLYAMSGYASISAPGWKAIVVTAGNRWLGVMPIYPKRKWGLSYHLQPIFCQYWGIFFSEELTKKTADTLSKKRKVVQKVIEALGAFSYLKYYFAPEFDYSLPFIWSGYQLSPRYTYHLALHPTEEILWQDTAYDLRRKVKKAKKIGLSFNVIKDIDKWAELVRLQVATGRQVMGGIPDWEVKMRAIAAYLDSFNGLHLYGVDDDKGNLVAAGIFAHFLQKAIFLHSVYLPTQKNSGAVDLLMWEAILHAKTAGCTHFDFEGSMIEGIEQFFRKFGAQPILYLQIAKNDLPLPLQWIRE